MGLKPAKIKLIRTLIIRNLLFESKNEGTLCVVNQESGSAAQVYSFTKKLTHAPVLKLTGTVQDMWQIYLGELTTKQQSYFVHTFSGLLN